MYNVLDVLLSKIDFSDSQGAARAGLGVGTEGTIDPAKTVLA